MKDRTERTDAPGLHTYTTIFKALSDETRLRIYLLLGKGEICVCQIQVALGMSQTKVSRHLTVLRHAGLVNARREGQWMYYSKALQDNPPLRAFVRDLTSVLEADEDLMASVATDVRCAGLQPEEIARMAKNT